MNIPSSVISLKHTATTDLKFHLVDVDLWVSEANIHVVTNDAFYGDFNIQEATITTLQAGFFKDFNLRDLFFRNAGAAANTTILIVGIRMLPARMEELGLV